MIKYFAVFFVLCISLARGGFDCSKFNKDNESAVGSLSFHHCQGVKEMSKKNYKEAIKFFKKALEIHIHEVPNYSSRLELGEAYCQNNEKAKGKKQIEMFLCMSALDLGYADCSEKKLKTHCPDMSVDLCHVETNFMGGLIESSKKIFETRRKRAKKSLESCNG